jgi:hypothetical protein
MPNDSLDVQALLRVAHIPQQAQRLRPVHDRLAETARNSEAATGGSL